MQLIPTLTSCSCFRFHTLAKHHFFFSFLMKRITVIDFHCFHISRARYEAQPCVPPFIFSNVKVPRVGLFVKQGNLSKQLAPEIRLTHTHTHTLLLPP